MTKTVMTACVKRSCLSLRANTRKQLTVFVVYFTTGVDLLKQL